MKWKNVLYYICISILTVFLVLMSVALPPAFIFVIPICGYLYAFPKLKVRKSSNDNTPMETKDHFKLKKQKYEEQIQNLLNDKQSLSKKIEIAYNNINQYKTLLAHSIPNMDGKIFEQYVGHRLLENDYKNIQFTAASGDFGADIIAFDKAGNKVCIQCKRYANTVGVEAVQQIATARTYYDCERAMVITNSTFTPAAKALANKTGVKLIEGFV